MSRAIFSPRSLIENSGGSVAAAAPSEGELLQALGKRRGAVLPGGRINTQKAAEILLNDLRAGLLGRLTLETPEEFAQWADAAAAVLAAKEAQRAEQRKAKRGTRDWVDEDGEDGAAPSS